MSGGRQCLECGGMGGWVHDVYDSEGEWAGSEWVPCSSGCPDPYDPQAAALHVSSMEGEDRSK